MSAAGEKFLAILLLLFCGCELRQQLKCVDGVVYAKENEVWIVHHMYDNNKCLSGGSYDQ